MKNLRFMEWHLNNMNCGNPFTKVFHKSAYALRWLRWRRLSQKYDVTVSPNNVGPGFHLVHYGFRHILSGTKIGRNCTILPMVLIGKKSPDLPYWQITIGDNCYIGTGATILGPVTIAKNFTIGAGRLFRADNVDALKQQLTQLLQSDTTVIVAAEKNFYQLHYKTVALREKLLRIYGKIVTTRSTEVKKLSELILVLAQ